jgi:hypothetical protein
VNKCELAASSDVNNTSLTAKYEHHMMKLANAQTQDKRTRKQIIKD